MRMLTLEDARPWYPQEDPVHGFDHVQRVFALVKRLALAEGADLEIVQAAALLHDARPPSLPAGNEEVLSDASQRADHHLASAHFARRTLQTLGWSEARLEAVLHCIRAHRFRDETEQPASLEAWVLFDADKLDAIGAIGVARAIAYAAMHQAPFYAPPSAEFITQGLRQMDEPHSAYHEYLFKLRLLKDRLYTSTARQIAEERHQFMAAFFERLSAEWMGEQ